MFLSGKWLQYSSSSRPHRLLLVVALAFCLVALLSVSEVRGQAKVGTTGAQFLELGVTARAMGMAEAFTAVADDISAVYYNPAGLVYMYGREAAFSYISMPADISYYFGAIGLPLESIGGVLGISAYTLTSGDMIETDYVNAADPQAGTGRIFSYNDFALAVSYGRYLTDRFSIGLSVKYIGEFAHDYSASGWSADVGTNYDTGFRNFTIAMAITNFGPDMRMIADDYPLPINFKFGAAINVIDGDDHVLTFAAEGSHPSDNLEKYNAGMEYTFKELFVLRGGGRFNYNVDGLTAGGGVRVPFGEESELRFDYAYQDFGILTEVHRFTMSIAF
ncbi:MAG: PorV/PorQ family protein [Candidatus Zixiibacteriota bacterium]|nr:MAG: PorV/PorQ family protein [candidate division Zixibacteria bacterium]